MSAHVNTKKIIKLTCCRPQQKMLEYVDSTPSLLACSSQHFFSVASSSANHVVKSWCKEGKSSALVVQNLVQLKFSIKNSTVQLCLGKNTGHRGLTTPTSFLQSGLRKPNLTPTYKTLYKHLDYAYLFFTYLHQLWKCENIKVA